MGLREPVLGTKKVGEESRVQSVREKGKDAEG